MLLVARSLIVGWTLVALLLAVRGGLTSPPPAPGWQIVVATLLLLSCASLMRIAGGLLSPDAARRDQRFSALGPLAGMALFAYWLVMLSESPATAALVIFLVAVHEVCWLVSLLFAVPSPASSVETPRRTQPGSGGGTDLDAPDDADLMLRRRHADGVEQIHGTARLRFEPGQRTASVPIGFSPPLVPDCRIEAEPIEGVDVAVKIVDASAVGFTLEARRSGAVQDRGEAFVEFFAAQHPATVSDPRLLAAE